MEIDQPEEDDLRKSEALRSLTEKRVLITSIAKLSGSSRGVPSQKDFHFYNNFQEFKNPVEEIYRKSKTLLQKIGASENVLGKPVAFPDDKKIELDDDVAYDWMESVNDEIFERFDSSLDEFKSLQRKEEESDVRMMIVGDDEAENGFQMVYEKTDKKILGLERNVEEGAVKGVLDVKVAAKVKRKIPFHVPTLPRPQDVYKITVNNSNQPFEHVWLRRSEDGSRFIHPLEKLSVLDFIDNSDSGAEPVEPPPIGLTPFKLVEEVKDLKQLAVKLRSVDEFAVDLEHNQYRSFQGLTCLMQISTRTEDFVIDTLKLRLQIGPHLREVFKDPTKRKVLHGADRDIVWLQRDFGIYVCNMFDTGQASRVLKMERYSLEYLLHHFCGVAANKEYQNADWRIRPLPLVMTKYAREDTHYLLYIYDLMRKRLLTSSVESESSDPPLVEVYKRSYNICIQLYEKELLTDSSYLLIYGLQDADFNTQQLAVVSELTEWRDVVARAEDESTGYVLPNRTLVEIAKQMPLTASNLRRLLKSKHPYIERNIDSVVSIIRRSIKNAAAFEEAVKYLKERRLEKTTKESVLDTKESRVLPHKARKALKTDDTLSENSLASVQCKEESRNIGSSKAKVGTNKKAKATVQVLKKPSQASGVLLGNSAKSQFEPDKRKHENTKLEQIKSSSLPLTFLGRDQPLQSDVKKSAKMLETSRRKETVSALTIRSTLKDIIVLDDKIDEEDSRKGTKSPSDDELMSLEKSIADFAAELDEDDEDEDEPMW